MVQYRNQKKEVYIVKLLKLLLAAAAVCIFAGCASTTQYVSLPDQSVEVEDPDMGRIYVLRPDVLGSAVRMDVTANDELIGTTGGDGYLCWETHPGMLTITGHAENVSSIDLSIQRGKAYYIYQAIRMGVWMARNELISLSEAKGKEYLQSCSPPAVVLEE